MNHLYLLLFLISLWYGTCLAQLQELRIDCSRQTGELKSIMGVNRGPQGLQTEFSEIGVSLIRTHDYHISCDYHIYTDFWLLDTAQNAYHVLNPAFDPLNTAHYHWETTDAQIHDIIDNGFEVYFRLGISWSLNTNYPTPPVTPPFDMDGRSFNRFAQVCKRTVMHINGSWAEGLNQNVRYWEVWNEPKNNLFWVGDSTDYYHLYQQVYDSLKSFDPALNVGAPGAVPLTTLGVSKAYRESFLNYLQQNQIGLDFYSWHSYGIKNPYFLRIIADSIRRVLDRYGFSEAESHISEINNELDETIAAFSDSPQGAAYYAAHQIVAQNAPIDRIIWYPGLGFFDSEAAPGAPQRYKWSAYAFKAVHQLITRTPRQIASDGDLLVESDMQTDTTHLSLMAGMSEDGREIGALISNYNSDRQLYRITFNNLPAQFRQSPECEAWQIKGPDKKLSAFTQMTWSDDTTLVIQNQSAPSVLLIFIKSEEVISVAESQTLIPQVKIYPNPLRNEIKISTALPYNTLEIFNLLGEKIYSSAIPYANGATGSATTLHLPELPPSIYFLQLRNGPVTIWRERITLIK